MNGTARAGGALPYGELDVAALLDSYGERLYLYFWLMLGDELSATRALTDTIIAVLPDPGPRELFTVAHRVCRQYQPAPAVPYAEAGLDTLASVTIAALRRLDPEEREICVLGAPRYRLDDTDLAAVLGAVDDLRPRAAAAFDSELAACAAEAGLEQDGHLAGSALRQLGSDAIALPYDQIVALATDAVLEGLREGIRTRVAVPAEAAPQPDRPLDALGTGPRAIVTFGGIEEAERVTVPLPCVPDRKSGRPGRWGRRALAGMVGAGVISAAIAGVAALGGHSARTGHPSYGGLQPVPQAAPPSTQPRSMAPSASSPAQVHGTGPGGSGGQNKPVATMPAGAPMATAPRRMVTPAPAHSARVNVTAPPTAPTMSSSPTTPPTPPASPTPAPSTTKLAGSHANAP